MAAPDRVNRRLWPVVLLIAGLATACGSSPPSPTPTVKATPTPRPTLNAEVIGCDQAVAGGPTIHGVSWADAKRGAIAGTGRFLWQTGDGGATWSVIDPPQQALSLNGVEFTSALHLWIWGEGGIFTVAPGAAWSPVATPLTSAVTSVAFNAGKPVAATGEDGTIVVTTDGGATWTKAVQTAGGVRLNAVVVADAEHLYAVGNAGTVLASADGGAHWVAEATGVTADLEAAAFVTASQGIVVGTGTTALVTAGAGTSWRALTFADVSADFYAVQFLDSGHGWIGGSGGQVVRTADGQTFNPSVVTDGVQLMQIAFLDSTHGWAVGTDTGLYETSDGGASWVRRNFCHP